jgi:secreted trypsin-like serine protease
MAFVGLLLKTVLLVFLSFCGVECQISPRIVGGFNVTSMEGFKHQVSIRSISRDGTYGNGHLCGGSLINYNTVLTAGL